MTIQKLAKWISWLWCGLVLLVNLHTGFHYRFHIGVFILFAVVAVQIWLLLSKRYIAAFRIISVELTIPTILLFFPDPLINHSPLPYKLTPSIWLFGGLALTAPIWICYKAAKDLKSASRAQNVNQQNALNYGIKEYFRPWKLAAFAAGLTILSAGSLYYRIPGWDIDNSLFTATLTYVTAPWVIYMVKTWQWRKLAAALFACVIVSFSYLCWDNAYFNSPRLDKNITDAYFSVFLLLYLLCGLLGSQRMNLREFLSKLADTVHLRASQTPLISRSNAS